MDDMEGQATGRLFDATQQLLDFQEGRLALRLRQALQERNPEGVAQIYGAIDIVQPRGTGLRAVSQADRPESGRCGTGRGPRRGVHRPQRAGGRPRTARPPTRSNVRAAGNEAAAWPALHAR